MVSLASQELLAALAIYIALRFGGQRPTASQTLGLDAFDRISFQAGLKVCPQVIRVRGVGARTDYAAEG